ncbi:ProQ/FINO family protein [Ramlibacter sp. Leaf400]|uniref:ProQ/FINO family protein n=1 Tax=Ramlibacter sp. Leaf400 TaxID=1736365 RepID=UPI0007008857|nr:ProQ/FINO family protein [Ramlibacter sp. Leaf400]KQT08948.1 prop effector [Ramlibacter sp. Leaf400]
MNDETPTAAPAAPAEGGAARQQKKRKAARPLHPVLHTLFELYPRLFGARFLPLKLGVFEEMVAAHPDRLKAEELKVALGLHTRSTRYLEAVAAGVPRHDLQAQPVEPVAPEHVHHAILELYRRKSATPQEPLARERAVKQLVEAVGRSGLGRDGYRERFGAGPDFAVALLDEALMAIGQKSARQEALQRAFQASGKSVEDFAEMYGLSTAEVKALGAAA